MKRFLILMIIILPVVFLQAQSIRQSSSAAKKTHAKEISASRLPKQVTAYISANLPNARITKVMKQKRDPSAKYVVHLEIKSKHHTLIFNKDAELVNLDGKRLTSTVLKKK
jgi:hypothetical protein